MGNEKFLEFLKVEAAAITDAQEKAEEDKIKTSQIAKFEECKSKEERRVLLNKWKTEEIVRKQREREKLFEKYVTEHPVQYPRYNASLNFQIRDFKLQDSERNKKQKIWDMIDKEEARKEIEKANDQFSINKTPWI